MRQFSRNTTTHHHHHAYGQLPHVAVLNSEKRLRRGLLFFFFTRESVGMDMGVSGPSTFNQCRAVYENGTIHLGGRDYQYLSSVP